MKKIFAAFLAAMMVCVSLVGCDTPPQASTIDRQKTLAIANKLSDAQPTPSDIDFSLERYNLIKRAY